MNNPEFSIHTRQNILNTISNVPVRYDAVIIGGGIVGAGLARELAIRGIECLLVEKGDFASGTSSKSSKLIHGGLRYLEMYDFGLVFESLAERHWLLKTHPHLVQPLEFNLPIYTRAAAPARARNSTLIGMGLWLYDALSLFRTPFSHGKHSLSEMLTHFPGLRAEGLKGGYYYADAMMLDDELVLEAIYDAYRRGAKPLNYVEATHIRPRNKDGYFEIELKNRLSDPALLQVYAKEVIVCVGPWTEKIGDRLPSGSARKLKPSKGVHLILPWERLPIKSCLVMYAPDGRIVFAIPRKDLGSGAEVVIIGTTDSPEKGPPEEVRSNQTDEDYLLSILNVYFPTRKIKATDISATFAGVRPLIDDGADTEAKVSREHEIWKNASGITFMAGGKYTTFRKISQEIAEFAFPHSSANDLESRSQLSTPSDYHLRTGGKPIWGRFTEEWVRWKFQHHCPCMLSDIVFRRMPLWMAGKTTFEQTSLRVAEISQPFFQWSKEEVISQLRASCEEARRLYLTK